MERIAMSQQERDRLDWLKRARDGKITQREAAQRMGVSERWVRELLRRKKKEGDRVVVHGLRGRASNRKIAAKVQARALEILKKAEQARISAGKDPMGLAAAALYVSCTLEGEDKTQRDVAEAAGVTEVTIRNRYKGLRSALSI